MSGAPGTTALLALVCCLLGLIMVMIGIVGEYVWRIYDELSRRPKSLSTRFTSERVATSPSRCARQTEGSRSPPHDVAEGATVEKRAVHRRHSTVTKPNE
ncbi:MAG: hypothetical protein U0521_18830 [Anaerolineae bacterium]